jgi:hypothetical protein
MTLRALEDFLARAFDEHGLRRLVRDLPGGEPVLRQLPGAAASPEVLVVAVVDALRRHGLLSHELFAALTRERPRRAAEIAALAASFAAPASTEPGVAAVPAPAASPARRTVVVLRGYDGLPAAERVQRGLLAQLADVDVLICRIREWSAQDTEPPTVACVVLFTSEFMKAPERHGPLQDLAARSGLRVFPVLVGGIGWHETVLGRLPPLPTNGVPIRRWKDGEAAWAEVLAGLARDLR